MRLREQSLPQDVVEWPRGVICDLIVDTRVVTANRTVYCKAEYELELTDQTVMRSYYKHPMLGGNDRRRIWKAISTFRAKPT